jgi:hypothetical protein
VNERKRIRSRMYEKKRRLRRQVLAGKITLTQAETILNDYAIRLGLAAVATCIESESKGGRH